MTIKVTETTEEVINFVKTRLKGISNVRAVDFLATQYLEKSFTEYQNSKIDSEWVMKSRKEFFEFLEKINYNPIGLFVLNDNNSNS